MVGIIYKVQPYLEHGKLLFLYTKKGKKTLVAQGAQKLKSNDRFLSQYLTKIEFDDENKGFHRLKQAKLINDYQKIKEDFYHTKHAALMLEIVDQAVDEHLPHETIFNELSLALDAKNLKKTSLSFAIKMLKYLGYELNLTGNGNKVIGLNIETGSLVYEGEKIKIDLETRDVIELLKLAKMPYSDLSEGDIKKQQAFVKEYYQYHLQLTLKNLEERG